MEYVSLGLTGPRVSRLGFGCWAMGGHGWDPIDDGDSIQAVRRALDLGVTLFDTADVYGLGHSEEVLSRALGSNRTTVVIATKGGVTWDQSGRIGRDCSARYLVQAVEASLRRLKLECIPLYQIHWPDATTPLAETVEALVRCQRQGKIQHLGCSNFSGGLLAEAMSLGTFVSLQIRHGLICGDGEHERMSRAAAAGVGVIAYDVLGKGLLTGKFGRDISFPPADVRSQDGNFRGAKLTRNLALVKRLRQVGKAHGKTAAQTAVRWVLDEPGVAVALTGITRVEQIEENVGAAGWSLADEERRRLSAPIEEEAGPI